MPKTRDPIKYYTPVSDFLAARYGIITAGVYGQVRRYTQMTDGKCYASLEHIGERLGLGRATVMRHLKVLVCEGYLTVEETKKYNHPDTYRLTKKDVWIKYDSVSE